MPVSRMMLAVAVLIVSRCALAAPTTIYVNGRIWTGEPTGQFANALAVETDRIVAVGDDKKIRALAGRQTRIVDLEGKLVVPGFIDNHTHFVDSSLSLASVDLRDAGSEAEFSRRIAKRAQERPGEWITHGNWDHELWGATLPTRQWIDEQTRETPVFVVRLDGHMGLANSAALKLAGIDARTADPAGGEIIRDSKGEPTGLLKDTAMNAVYGVIPPSTERRIDEAVQRGFKEALSHGVTQIHDMSDGNWRALESFRRARAAGKLGVRVYSFVPIADWQKMAEFVRERGKGDDWLRWGALKGFVDGSLGSTTAWFHEPYDDAPETSGLTMVDPKELARQIQGADGAGLHVAVHAIGDRANDWLLDTYERVARDNGARDRRFRIEHAQHVRPEAFARYAGLGVIASMQPYHAIDDGRWAEKRIGQQRLKGTYAFRSFLDAGAQLTFGSDWAVAPLDPMSGIDAAVNRRTIDGKNPQGWQPQQRISVAEAVRAYTLSNAYAGFQEQRLGRIAPGYLADFAVLSEDIFSIDPARIRAVRVLRTVVGGEDRYVAPANDQDVSLGRARQLLRKHPVIDGHNDLPYVIREHGTPMRDIDAYDLRTTTPGDTDLKRLRDGGVGGQFWSVFVPSTDDVKQAGFARVQLEQIDIALRVIERYPDDLQLALTAADIEQANRKGRIASLLGAEGGHVLENSLGALRTYYRLGVRYMTLTHWKGNDWADSATDEPRHGGLTAFGKEVIGEMNRLGMLVDLSHVSVEAMNDALDVAVAPVIFSHSNAKALTPHPRNVPDDVLRRLSANGGIVMASFLSIFNVKGSVQAAQGQGAEHPEPRATIGDVADHIEHLRKVAGPDHLGIGSDFYGAREVMTIGLEDTSGYPALFAELIRRGWSDEELIKLSRGNLIRVLRAAERTAVRLQQARSPSYRTIEEIDRGQPKPNVY